MLDTKDKIVKAITQVLDIKGLSRDIVNALVDKAGKQKDVLIGALAKEFTLFLSKMDVTEEARKILEGMTLKVDANISLVRKNKKTKKGKNKNA